MADVKEIDIIVRGEGEATALHLMTALRDGRPLSDVAGVVWRRDQVVATANLSPTALFLAVKASEFFIHGRPKRILRSLVSRDKHIRGLARRASTRALIVWLVEIVKDFPRSGFVPAGKFSKYPKSVRILMPRDSRKFLSSTNQDQ